MQRPDAAFYLNPLSFEQRDALERERQAGESLLWVGCPCPFAFARKKFFPVVAGLVLAPLASLIVIAFVVNMDRTSNPDGWEVAIFAAGLAIVGFYLITAPFLALREAKRTIYLVTDKRVAAIVYRSRKINTTNAISMDLIDSEMLSSREHKNGIGDVLFVCWEQIRLAREARWHEGFKVRLLIPSLQGFYGIENPRYVEQLIRDIFGKH